MLKDNLKLLLLGIAIVQMPLVGFSMKPVKQQPETSSVSADQLKYFNFIVQELRENAFNDEVINPKEVDDLIRKRYTTKILDVIGKKNLPLLRKRFIYDDTETTIEIELDCYKKAKLCKSNRLETFKAAIKNDDPILLEYAYKVRAKELSLASANEANAPQIEEENEVAKPSDDGQN